MGLFACKNVGLENRQNTLRFHSAMKPEGTESRKFQTLAEAGGAFPSGKDCGRRGAGLLRMQPRAKEDGKHLKCFSRGRYI